MSDSLEIIYCPHCKRPVSITEVKSLDDESSVASATGDVKEQSLDEADLDFQDPTIAKRIGFKR